MKNDSCPSICFLSAILLALAPAQAPAMQSVQCSIHPSALASDATNEVRLTITGLAPGQTVRVEQFLDFNGDGVVNAGEILVQSLRLTDGEQATVGGVRNLSVPGDDEGLTNGTIGAVLELRGEEEILLRAGRSVFRVSPDGSGFAPITASLHVTQPASAQSVVGQIRSGGAPVPHALAFLLDPSGDAPVAIALADSNGWFTLACAPGTWLVGALRSGYVFDASSAAPISVSAGGTVTNNVTLSLADRTVSGRLTDGISGEGLAGVEGTAESEAGLLTLFHTDTNGAFVASVSSDEVEWRLEFSTVAAGRLGCAVPRLEFESGVLVNLSTGSVSGLELSWPRADALAYGIVRDDQGRSLAHYPVTASGWSTEVSGHARADGRYALGVLAGGGMIKAGTAWLEGSWYYGEESWMWTQSDQPSEFNLAARPANILVAGRVVDDTGAPVAHVEVQLSTWGGFLDVRAGPDGRFAVNLFAGPWTMRLDQDDAQDKQLIGPDLQFAVEEGQPLTNLLYVVLRANLRLSGTLLDTQGQPLAGLEVYAYGQAGTTNLGNVSAVTDPNGVFELAVASGDWSLGFDCSALGVRGLCCPQSQTVTVTNTNPFVSLVAPAFQVSTNLPEATVGQSYSWVYLGNCSGGSYTWSVLSNAPPDGLTVGSDGYLNGTPNEVGLFTFTVRASNATCVVEGSVNLRVQPPPSPDLMPLSLTAPGAPNVLTTISLSYLVTNIGPAGASGPWADKVYLSADDQWDVGDRLLGNWTIWFYIPTGSAYSRDVPVNLPCVAPGNWFLLVAVDANEQLTEQVETNNVLAVPIEVRADLSPDLRPLSLTAPEAVEPGVQLVVSWAGTNAGGGTAPRSWTDRLYLSTDPVFDTNDVELCTPWGSCGAGWWSALGAGLTYTQAFWVELPAAAPGNYFLLLQLDADGQICEQTETNNLFARPLTLQAQADLQPLALAATGTVAVAGSFDIVATFTNHGPATAVGGWMDELYLSADAVLNRSEDTYLTGWTWPADVPAGSTYAITQAVQLVCMPPGDYYLLVTADAANQVFEGDESNNLLAVPLTVGDVADLAPVRLEAPPFVSPRQTVQVTWVATNAGTLAAQGPWWDRLYLSTNATWDAADAEVPSPSCAWCFGFAWSETVPAGLLYTQAVVQIQVPNVPPGAYYLILRLNADQHLCEGDRANNNLAVPIQIGSPADLRAEGIVAPDMAASGEEMQVTWAVTNVGPESAYPPWVDVLYLSTNNAVWDEADVPLTSATWSQEVPASQGYTRTLGVRLPSLPAGNYHLIVRVDDFGLLGEVSETNNAFAKPLTVVNPDLTPVSLVAPAAVAARQSFTVNWSVLNQGSGLAVAAWYDRFYLSTDATWDEADRELNAAWVYQPVPAGHSYTQSVAVALPDVASGAYYLILRTDAGNYLWESGETNNHRVVSLTVANPDLATIQLAGLAPRWAASATASSELGNNAARRAVGPPDGLHCSASTNGWIPNAWGTNVEWLEVTFAEPAEPLGLIVREIGYAGFIIRVDLVDTNDTYHTVWTGTDTTTCMEWFLLRFASLPYGVKGARIYTSKEGYEQIDAVGLLTELPGSIAGASQQEVLIYWQVANPGPGLAAPPWSDRLYFSTDSTWDTNDLQLASHPVSQELMPAGDYAQVRSLRLPQVGDGSYWLIVRTDGSDVFYESDELNNERAIPVVLAALPDLNLATFSGPASACSQEPITVSWTVSNVSTSTTQVAWTDRLYLSTNELGSSQDMLLRVVGQNQPLAAGARYTNSVTVGLPGVPAGAYYLLVRADADGALFESSETNNLRSLPLTLGNPDIVPVVFAVPTTVMSTQRYQTLTVSWTVANQGACVAQSPWGDDLYLSNDPVWDAQDRWLGYYWQQTPLPAGDQYTYSQTVTLPENAAGSYYLIMRTDTGGVLYETANGNNVTQRVVNVVLAPLPDLVVANIQGPIEAVSGQSVQVSWVVTNQGGAAAVGPWVDYVYLASSPEDPQPVSVGQFDFQGTVGPGAAVQRAQRITMPGNLSGDRWIVVRTDAHAQVFEREGESNNVSVALQAVPVRLQPYPNLAVTHVNAPPTAYSSQQAVVEWGVTNRGTGGTTVATWSDQVYLSADAIFDPNTDTALHPVPTNPSYLDAGEGYMNSVSVTLPRGIEGTYHFIVKTDVYNDVNEHTNEHDNVQVSGPVQVLLTPPADLQVVNVQTPVQSFSGQSVALTWTVTNAGVGRTLESAWWDGVYVSRTNELNESAVWLGRAYRAGMMPAASTYTVSNLLLNLPVALTGACYFIIHADVYSQVYEHVFEANNTGVSSRTTDVRLTPPPDLEVTLVNAPATALAGRNLAVAYRVANYGSTATPNTWWEDHLYLSADAEFSPQTDLRLATLGHWGALDLGSEYSATFNVTLPDTFSGLYYAFVFTDAGNVVFELNNTNNIAFDLQPINVGVQTPDLVVSQVNAPATANAGSALLLSWTVANQGVGDSARTRWADRVVLSADLTLGNSDDVNLGSVTREGLLGAGASYTVSNHLVAVPITIAAGAYHLYVVTDVGGEVYEGTAETNNASSPQSLAISRNTADLQMVSVSAPSAALSEDAITVTWVVQNQGNAAPHVTYWTDAIYLSSDRALSADDRLLSHPQSLMPLPPGAAYTNSLVVTVPANAQGDYYVIVMADVWGSVVEPGAKENNALAATNLLSVSLRPVADLVISNLELPAEAFGGQPLALTWTTRNQGTAPATANWHETVYLSLDQFWDRESDVYLGFAYRPHGLTNGQEYTRTQPFNLPAGLSGLFYVFIVTDAGNVVKERSGEANNVRMHPVALQVRLQPPADLVAGPITIPANGVPGQNVEVTYTIYNQGANAARGAWLDSLYVSADAQWDLGDALLGRVWHSGDVPAGSNYTHSLSGPLPGVLPGDYHVIVRSDILNHVAELNEANNVGASLDRMELDAEELPLGVVKTNFLYPGNSAYYRFNATAGETIRLRFDAQAAGSANEIYVRFGQMPSRGRFDFAANEPFVADPELVLPIEQTGTYYVLAYAATAPTAFSLRADILPFSVTRVTPGQAGNQGQVTLRIEGALFTTNTAFQLLHPSLPPLSAVAVRVQDSATALATFNLFGAPTGACTVRAVLPGTPPVAADLPGGLLIQDGFGPRVELALDGDLVIRPNRITTFRLLYGNTGDADIAAPLILVSSATGRPIGFNSGDLRTTALHVLGLNSGWPLATLPPGSLHSVMMHVETTVGGSDVGLRAYPVLADDLTPLSDGDWLAIEQAVRPGPLTEVQWSIFWSNLRLRIGSTWGDYVRFLHRLAEDLSARGPVDRDVRAMMAAIYTEDPSYRASSTLGGQVLDATNGTARASLDLGIYRLVDGRHVLGGFTQTDAEGRFTLRFLPAGEYEFALLSGGFDMDRDGLGDAQPPRLTVARDTDQTNLVIYTVPEAAFTSSALNDDSPALTLDSVGAPHILWSRGGFVWHAWLNGEQWVDARAVSEAPGSNLSLESAPNLLDGSSAGLIAVWEQGADNAAEIFYAVGRPGLEGGYQWSRPVQLTRDAVRDAVPVVRVNAAGQALIACLKRDATIRDDTDIYFAVVDVASGALEWFGPAAQINLAGSGGLHFGYIKKWGPYYAFGTRFETGIDVGLDGKVSGCSASLSGNAKGMMSFLLPGFRGFDFEGSGSLNANWEANKRRCEWQFKGAQLDAAVQGTFVWKDGLASCLNGLGPGGVAAAKGIHLAIAAIHRFTPLRVEQGINFSVAVEMGDLRWTRVPPMPGWVGPDHIGSMDLIAGLGPYAKLQQENVGDVEMNLSGAIQGKLGILPSFTPKELSGAISLAARVRSFSFNRTWNITLAGGDEGPPLELAGAPELPGGLVMVYDPSAALGTTNVYGPNALRADVAGDLYRDSAPVLLRRANGTLVAVWSREEDPAGTDDNLLYVAEFNGTTWSPPTAIPGSGGLHSGLHAVMDSQDRLLVVWSVADGSTLGPGTTFEQLQSVRDSADLFWTVHDGNAWTAPVRLALTDGPDGDVNLALLANGEVLATWIHRDASAVVHLVTALWNGITWSTVTELASGDVAMPRAVQIAGVPTVFWSEDTNPDPEVEQNTLRFRRFVGTWQPAQVFAPTPADLPAPPPAAGERVVLASSFLPSVPDSCCECKKIRHVTQGSGDCIRGKEFDEATCTWITFYKPCVVQPTDPNDILGPKGFGEERWVPATATLGYTIRFENMTNAAAPAQEVFITHPLDPDLDWRTFRLGNFGLGTVLVTVPTNRAFYSARLDLIESHGFFVDVAAGIDVASGEAFWRFTTIDPATGETPTDPRRGFLPPNTNAPAGEGYVTYTIRPKSSAATGSRIDALATIIFDTEAPLDTPPIFNTLEGGVPDSQVLALPTAVPEAVFPVGWSGADEVGGSALAGYDIYVSENDGPYKLWLGNTTLTEAPYSGVAGHTYAFYSVARDNAGNEETAPETPDTVTTVAAPNSAPLLTVPETLTVIEHHTVSVTNIASDTDLPTQQLTFSLGTNAPAGATLDPTNGVFTWTPGEADGPGSFEIMVIVTDSGLPSLSATQSFTINVLETNSPPVLAVLDDTIVPEESLLRVRALATDADLPPNGLTFSLGTNAPAGAAIDPATGWLTWTPDEDHGPGSYTFDVIVTDDGAPPLTGSRPFTVTVLESNSVPRLAPVPTQTAYVLTGLIVTNTAFDSDPRGDALTFSLGPDAPSGSMINPTNGLFMWRPSRAQAPGTNIVTVWVTDDGSPPLAGSNTFTVLVTDYLELELVHTVARAGHTTSVPVRVTATAGVEDLDFQFHVPADQLTLLSLTNVAANIQSNSLEAVTPDVWRLRLGSAPGLPMIGTQTVAQLEFRAASGLSAFVPLVLSNLVAVQTNGLPMSKTLAGHGRVTVVGTAPLLEAYVTTNGQRSLRLYGPPEATYAIEQMTAVGVPWQPAYTNLSITNLLRVLPGLPQTNATIYYRVRQE